MLALRLRSMARAEEAAGRRYDLGAPRAYRPHRDARREHRDASRGRRERRHVTRQPATRRAQDRAPSPPPAQVIRRPRSAAV
jgi:hypothetical protein